MAAVDKKLTKSKSGIKIVPIKDSQRSPFELREPAWMKDSDSFTCTSCDIKFDFLRRRHHCRRCGYIFCDTCTKARLPLPRMCFLDPVRICKSCTMATQTENIFYQDNINHLQAGTKLTVTFSDSFSTSTLTHCRLSTDHRYLLLPGANHPSILFDKLVGRIHIDQSNSPSGFSLALRGDDLKLKLEAGADHSATTNVFLESLQVAMKLVDEARPIIGTGN